MIPIEKDDDKCLKEGFCTEVCPLSLWLKTENGIRNRKDIESFCIGCGHCIAVCPAAALSSESFARDSLRSLPKGWRGNPQQMENILKGRRSTRSFKQKIVPAPILNSIVEVASAAPSSCNRHNLRWLIVSDKKTIQAVSAFTMDLLIKADGKSPMPWLQPIFSAYQSGLDPICRKTPHLLITSAPGSVTEDYAVDSAIALTYAEIAAVPYGLSACWAGFLMNAAKTAAEINKLLNLSADQIILGCLMIGYPQFEFHRIPPRNKPKIDWL